MNIRMESNFSIKNLVFCLTLFESIYNINTFRNFVSSHKSHLYNIRMVDFKKDIYNWHSAHEMWLLILGIINILNDPLLLHAKVAQFDIEDSVYSTQLI